jgi:hypothetical protein
MIVYQQLKQFLAAVNPIESVNYPGNLQVFAPALRSLEERDWTVMTELFDREDSDEIEADIRKSLLLMMPEPCWEDDPFDFLSEYL